jgi:hypothetical protein
VVLGAAAGIVAAWGVGAGHDPALGLVVQTTGDEPTLTATVTAERLDSGAEVAMTVEGPADEVVVTGKAVADAAGTAKIEATAAADGESVYTMVVWVDGVERGRLVIP